MVCAALTHMALMCIGLALLLQATQISLTLGVADTGSPWVGLRDAGIMVLRNIFGPFFEGTLLDGMETQAFDSDVLGIWGPSLFSILFMGTALLGFSTVRYRRPSSAAAYALFSAVLLVWMADAGDAIREVSNWEDVSQFGGKNSRGKDELEVQLHVFKTASSMFLEHYKQHQCSVAGTGAGRDFDAISCSEDTLESNLFELLLYQVCQPPSPSESAEVAEVTQHANTCRKRGLEFVPLSDVQTEGQHIFCRCWVAVFRLLRIASHGFMLFWFTLLLGVLAVLYDMAEPKLSKMCPIERAEVLTFAAIVMFVLSLRVTFFSDGFPSWMSVSSLLGLW